MESRETTAGGADLWVMDPQVQMSEGPKPLSDTALQRVRSVSGVAWAVPMYKGWLKCRLPDGTPERRPGCRERQADDGLDDWVGCEGLRPSDVLSSKPARLTVSSGLSMAESPVTGRGASSAICRLLAG